MKMLVVTAAVGAAFILTGPTGAAALASADQPVAGDQAARLAQSFTVDGLVVRIESVTPVGSFADGTAADDGARILQVKFWARNPGTSDLDFFDRFYAYATMSDGSDTDGAGLSFYPIASDKEFGDVTLKPGQTQHARFDLEVPTNSNPQNLVVFGPVDGAKVTIPIPAARSKM